MNTHPAHPALTPPPQITPPHWQELYAHYVQQVKERAYGLSDPHRAILLRKAMHYFNTRRLHLERRRGAAAAASNLSVMAKPVITVRDTGWNEWW
jgi:hypothetical protein